MSESEHIAAAPHATGRNPPMDDEDRLRPEFVDKVLDAVDAGDDETARKLVEPLHPADIADLIELARARRARRAGQGAGRDRRRRSPRRNERLGPRGTARRDGAAAGRGHRRAARDRRRGRADRGPRRDEQQAVLAAHGARRPRRGRGSAELSGGIRRSADAARHFRRARALERRPGDRLSALDGGPAGRFLGSVRGQPGAPSGRHLHALDHPAYAAQHAGQRCHARATRP